MMKIGLVLLQNVATCVILNSAIIIMIPHKNFLASYPDLSVACERKFAQFFNPFTTTTLVAGKPGYVAHFQAWILTIGRSSCSPPTRFNYRSTHYMAMNGFYNFLNWFDDRAWYPLGRIVGGTVSQHSSAVTVNV